MNFPKAKVHVSIFNEYVNFYENKKNETGSVIKKNGIEKGNHMKSGTIGRVNKKKKRNDINEVVCAFSSKEYSNEKKRKRSINSPTCQKIKDRTKKKCIQKESKEILWNKYRNNNMNHMSITNEKENKKTFCLKQNTFHKNKRNSIKINKLKKNRKFNAGITVVSIRRKRFLSRTKINKKLLFYGKLHSCNKMFKERLRAKKKNKKDKNIVYSMNKSSCVPNNNAQVKEKDIHGMQKKFWYNSELQVDMFTNEKLEKKKEYLKKINDNVESLKKRVSQRIKNNKKIKEDLFNKNENNISKVEHSNNVLNKKESSEKEKMNQTPAKDLTTFVIQKETIPTINIKDQELKDREYKNKNSKEKNHKRNGIEIDENLKKNTKSMERMVRYKMNQCKKHIENLKIHVIKSTQDFVEILSDIKKEDISNSIMKNNDSNNKKIFQKENCVMNDHTKHHIDELFTNTTEHSNKERQSVSRKNQGIDENSFHLNTNNGILNIKEFCIYRDIKKKERNEFIHLNFDSSFYVSSRGAGLQNHGENICFFNSIVQAIVRIPYICKDLINKLHSLNCERKKKRAFCFYCIFENFACNLISKNNEIKNALVPYLKKFVCSAYKRGFQEDVHEYLRYFLSSLEKCSLFSSIYIQKMFTGVIKNVTTCIRCNNVSLKYEQYYELSLDISTSNNLNDALKKFLSKEILSGENGYFCEKCKRKTVASKQCVINKLPRILTIQIKRFFMNSRFNIVKNHKFFAYPLQLDMQDYVNNYDMFKNQMNESVIALYEKIYANNNNNDFTGNNVTQMSSSLNKSQEMNVQRMNKHLNVGLTCKSEVQYNEKFRTGTFTEDLRSKSRNETTVPCNDSCSSNACKDFNHMFNSMPTMVSKLKGGSDNYRVRVVKEVEKIFCDLKQELAQINKESVVPHTEHKRIILEKKGLIAKELKKLTSCKKDKNLCMRINEDLSELCDYYSKANGSSINVDLFKCNPIVDDTTDESSKHSSESDGATEENMVPSMKEEKEKESGNVKNKSSDDKMNYKMKDYFKFELTGLIKHIGSCTEFGHYVALTKSKNNIYLECDDNVITHIKEKDVLNCVKNAYVFIYTCINPHFVDFYNKYIDVFEKKNFDMSLPVFEENVEFRERITMPKHAFINKSILY